MENKLTSDSTKVAILIPTLNRSDFMIRQLEYYADVACRHTVYVGDSSNDKEANLTAKAIKRLEGRLNVVHLRIPGLNFGEAIRETAYAATEPYAAMLGDDDFFVPSALEECAAFLENNLEYATANGVAFMCDIDRATGDYQITSSSIYGLTYVEGASAKARLENILGRSFETLFSVHRIAGFRTQLDAAVELPDKNFGIMLLSSLAAIQGISKQIESFFLVRLIHLTPYQLPSGFDWVLDENWLPSYELYCAKSAEMMAQEDHISVEEARAVVERALRLHLAARLVPELGADFMNGSARLLLRLRRFLRKRPRLKDVLIKIRRSSPIQDRMSLSRVLRPSSPYHNSFMPIYNSGSETVSDSHDREPELGNG